MLVLRALKAGPGHWPNPRGPSGPSAGAKVKFTADWARFATSMERHDTRITAPGLHVPQINHDSDQGRPPFRHSRQGNR